MIKVEIQLLKNLKNKIANMDQIKLLGRVILKSK